MTGTLFVVATPIGNLADASPRVAQTLGACELVLCEDTRRTGRLLQALGIEARMRTCHEHDEAARIPEVLALLRQGKDVALVTDAGTPALSDPGYRLVAAAHDAGLRVSPIPGPSAVMAALSACGLPTSSFVFEGFLPRKRGPRRRLLASLADEPRTLVFFETPHRAAESLKDLAEILGEERPACLARELTKLHEEVRRTTLGALRDSLADGPRGELVFVVSGRHDAAPPGAATPADVVARYEGLVAGGMPEREALRTAAREHGLSRREAYRLAKIAPDAQADDEE